jgi:hypothetical protein
MQHAGIATPRHRQRWFARVATIAGLLSILTACHRTKQYESNVEVTRVAPVRKDETGKPITLDFEMSYVECPGTQIEVVRGDAALAACVSKYKVGTQVKVGISHEWASEGHYTWVVRKIGDCERIPDPADEASYAMVRECDDWQVNGTKVGFQCKYIPEKKLVDKCPWFRRR